MSTIERVKTRETKTVSEFTPEALNFGVWIWYSDEDRILFSEGLCRMLGITKDTYLTFELFIECICADDLENFYNVMLVMVRGSQPRWMSFRVCLPDKSIRLIKCYVETMVDEFTEVYGITGVCFLIFD